MELSWLVITGQISVSVTVALAGMYLAVRSAGPQSKPAPRLRAPRERDEESFDHDSNDVFDDLYDGEFDDPYADDEPDASEAAPPQPTARQRDGTSAYDAVAAPLFDEDEDDVSPLRRKKRPQPGSVGHAVRLEANRAEARQSARERRKDRRKRRKGRTGPARDLPDAPPDNASTASAARARREHAAAAPPPAPPADTYGAPRQRAPADDPAGGPPPDWADEPDAPPNVTPAQQPRGAYGTPGRGLAAAPPPPPPAPPDADVRLNSGYGGARPSAAAQAPQPPPVTPAREASGGYGGAFRASPTGAQTRPPPPAPRVTRAPPPSPPPPPPKPKGPTVRAEAEDEEDASWRARAATATVGKDADPLDDLPDAVLDQIVTLLQQGKRVLAIKEYRAHKLCGFREGKEAVTRIARESGIETT